MNEALFRQNERRNFVYRLIDFLSCKKIFIFSFILLCVGIIIAWVENSWTIFIKPMPIFLYCGMTLAFLLLRWSRNNLAITIEKIRPAFIEPENYDNCILQAFRLYPNNLFTAILGILLFVGGYLIIPNESKHFTLGFLILFCIIAALLISFGLLGFIFICRLIHCISCQHINLFYDFYTKPLSSYICLLGSIGFLTIAIFVSAWIQTGNNILLPLIWIGTPLCILGYILMELRIWWLIYRARDEVIKITSESQKKLWDSLRWEKADKKDILEKIEKLEKLNEAVRKRRVNFIPWDDFLTRIIIPILIYLVAFTIQIKMKEMMTQPPPEKPTATSNSEQ